MAGGAGDEVVEVSCGGGDPGAYAAVLKRKLDLYCAAVAKSMEARSQESSLGHPNSQASDTSQLISQASDTSQLISQASDTSQLISQASFDGNGDRTILFINSHVIDNANCRSKEQSDNDDDLEENTGPINAKKKRRMLSNRESARRSRKRKQTHLNDLESQVSQLTAENASLLKCLADMTQKYKDATIDVDMMRRKVNIAEEAVRVTGASMLLLHTKSDMPGRSMPLTSCASDAASAAVPIQESTQNFLQESVQDDQIKLDLPNAIFPLTSMDMGTRLAPLRRITSLENLQKRINGDSVQSEIALPLLDPEALAPVAYKDFYVISGL